VATNLYCILSLLSLYITSGKPIGTAEQEIQTQLKFITLDNGVGYRNGNDFGFVEECTKPIKSNRKLVRDTMAEEEEKHGKMRAEKS
jgi:hypothetical protein